MALGLEPSNNNTSDPVWLCCDVSHEEMVTIFELATGETVELLSWEEMPRHSPPAQKKIGSQGSFFATPPQLVNGGGGNSLYSTNEESVGMFSLSLSQEEEKEEVNN